MTTTTKPLEQPGDCPAPGKLCLLLQRQKGAAVPENTSPTLPPALQGPAEPQGCRAPTHTETPQFPEQSKCSLTLSIGRCFRQLPQVSVLSIWDIHGAHTPEGTPQQQHGGDTRWHCRIPEFMALTSLDSQPSSPQIQSSTPHIHGPQLPKCTVLTPQIPGPRCTQDTGAPCSAGTPAPALSRTG